MKLQMSPPTIAVILPCFNEALAVRQVLDEFKEHLPAAALHVFDNRSTDDTARVAHVHLRIVLDHRASALHRHNAMLAKRMLKRSGRSRVVGHCCLLCNE